MYFEKNVYIVNDIMYNKKKRPTPHAQNERAASAVPPPPHYTGGSEYDEGIQKDTLVVNSISAGRKHAPGHLDVWDSSAPPGPPALP